MQLEKLLFRKNLNYFREIFCENRKIQVFYAKSFVTK
jgi:hypothetical protein